MDTGDHKKEQKIDLNSLKEKLLSTQVIVSGAVIFVLIFVVVLIVNSCAPKKGSIIYGLCGAFLEQQVEFPLTLKHTSVEQYPKAVRIYFTYIDGFGQYQFEMTECTFAQHPRNGVQLERVFFNHIKEITDTDRIEGSILPYEVKQEYIDLFNKSKSPLSILSHDPDLSLPQGRRYRF